MILCVESTEKDGNKRGYENKPNNKQTLFDCLLFVVFKNQTNKQPRPPPKKQQNNNNRPNQDKHKFG